jgi:hypothetical protein
LIEHLEARPDGVEVTWLLREPPPQAADLVIAAEVQGFSSSLQRGPDYHCCDATGLARVKIGPATACDAEGRTWPI